MVLQGEIMISYHTEKEQQLESYTCILYQNGHLTAQNRSLYLHKADFTCPPCTQMTQQRPAQYWWIYFVHDHRDSVNGVCIINGSSASLTNSKSYPLLWWQVIPYRWVSVSIWPPIHTGFTKSAVVFVGCKMRKFSSGTYEGSTANLNWNISIPVLRRRGGLNWSWLSTNLIEVFPIWTK